MVSYRMLPIVLLLGGVFLYFSHLMFDSDLGWSLRWGQYLLEHGMRYSDPFSYSMPGYPFIDHEWLIHALQFLLYEAGGPLALGIVFVFPLLLTLWLLVRKADAPWKVIHLLLLAAALLQTFIPKPSLFTLLFVCVEMLLLTSSWKWRRVVLTGLFLLWANIHGGFLYGLGIYVLWEGGAMLEKRTIRPTALLGVCAAALATLVNPYGAQLWVGVLESVTDFRLRLSVSEWQSSFSVIHLGTMFIISMYLTLLWLRRKTLRPTEIVLLLITLIMGLTSRRNLPLWIVLAAPYVNDAVRELEHIVRSTAAATKRLRSVYIGLFVFVSIIFLYELTFITGQMRLRGEAFYPQSAIAYLRLHPCNGRVFVPYEWGGYYLWSNPEKQVFIDGRMPSWRNTDAPYPDSQDALGDTYKLLLGDTSVRSFATRFRIGCFLLPTALVDPQLPSSTDAQRTRQFRTTLLQEGNIVYQDAVSVIVKIHDEKETAH